MIRLSFIVPVYKVEPFIEKCLRSLEEQDISREEYEIICINDGSPDNSREIIIGLQKEFGNIRLIEQHNQGVSVARNKGIEIANGDYIMMVDADDFLQPNILKKNLDILYQKDLEVAYTGYTILDESNNEEFFYDPLYDINSVLTGIEFLKKYRREKLDLIERDPHRSAGIFFKRTFLNSNYLHYLSDVPFLEDGELMARLMCLANRVVFINGPLYMRTTRAGSATQSNLYYSEKARNGFIKSSVNLVNFRNNNCTNDDQKHFINSYIVHFAIVSIISVKPSEYFKMHSYLHKELKKGPLKNLETAGCSDWYGRLAKSYNCSIHCFYLNWLFYRFRKSIEVKIKKITG